MHFARKNKIITVRDWLVIPCDRLRVYTRQYTVEPFTASTAEKINLLLQKMRMPHSAL